MSDQHLAKGSDLPPKSEGKLRLYSMLFCPFAQRARLILKVKGVPHDIVNIHLQNKPEWLFELNPEGKVPILDTGTQIIPESLVISDYLDQQYPDPPLYPKDDEQKKLDKELISSFGNILGPYHALLWNKDNKTLSENIENIKPQLDKLEQELEKRGKYFGGEYPNMVDYMIWPWAERAELVSLVYNEQPFPATAFPKLRKWCKAMRTQKAVKETLITPDRHFKLVSLYKQGGVTDYDSI